MGPVKLLILMIFIALTCNKVSADSGIQNEAELTWMLNLDSMRLKLMIPNLEFNIKEKSQGLRTNGNDQSGEIDSVQVEKVIKEAERSETNKIIIFLHFSQERADAWIIPVLIRLSVMLWFLISLWEIIQFLSRRKERMESDKLEKQQKGRV